MEYVFSPYLKTESREFFGPHYVREFREGMAFFGTPAFFPDRAERFVQSQHKNYRWMAERIVAMLTELRYVLTVLAEHPILVDTGQYVPQYRQRSYQDQENLVANELSASYQISMPKSTSSAAKSTRSKRIRRLRFFQSRRLTRGFG